MTAPEIVQRVKALKFPPGSYVVYGSCPMAIAGIREARDIDLLVTPELLKQLAKQGWKLTIKAPNDTPLVHDVFEAHDHWLFSAYSPSLEQLLSTATEVDGVPFASLEEVLKWKLASTHPKFAKDAELIRNYFERCSKADAKSID